MCFNAFSAFIVNNYLTSSGIYLFARPSGILRIFPWSLAKKDIHVRSEAQIQYDLVSSMVGLEQSKKDKVRERERTNRWLQTKGL